MGETPRSLKEMFYEHFYDWRNLKYPAKAPPVYLTKILQQWPNIFVTQDSLDEVKYKF